MATLLDDFNRANENPLSGGGNWGSKIPTGDSGGLQLTSNVVAKTGSGSTWSESYWSAATFGPDVEVTAKIGSCSAADSFSLFLRITNPNTGTVTAYEVDVSFQFNVAAFYKWINNVPTQVGTSVVIGTYLAGDILGFSAIGTTLTFTRNGSTVLTRTDSSISGSGFVGLGINNNGSGTLDDFSGDTVSSTKSITGGNINATSTLNGTVVAQKHISPATITATSTLTKSNNVSSIIPTTGINATSTVSGTVRTKHLIKPTTSITATSTLSASFTKARVVIVSGINAISTLSGAFVLKPGNLLPANIRATSVIYELGLVIKTVPAGYYGAFDIEDGIIP